MSDEQNNPLEDWQALRRDADKGREPDLVAARSGQRLVSVQALIEKIERAFIEEYANTPALAEADTQVKRLKLLVGTVNYVLAVESVQMSGDETATLIAQVYSNLFGYGVLDSYLTDERVTTISLEGIDKASVRYGHGDLVPVGPLFEDEAHMRRILRRLLVDAGTDLPEEQPFIETGLRVGERPVCVNLTLPPVAYTFNADIRVHPAALPSPRDLVESGFLSGQAVTLLQALAQSPHGFVIVGDTESGKTTLLSVLAQFLSQPGQAVSVERAGELRLPEGVQRLKTRWPVGDETGVTFGEQISAALAQQPQCILLDEVRTDEPQSIAPLLAGAEAPRQLWSFRGPFDAKRLRSALSMLARRADMTQGEALVNALYRRLPFIVTLWRAQGRIRLYSVAEWQFTTSDYPDYTLLLETRDGEHRLTGQRPVNPLGLPEDFWNS